MSIPVIILGAGGHAKVLIDILRLQSIPILGIVIPEGKKGDISLNLSVIGSDDEVKAFPPDQILLVNGLGSTGLMTRRRILFEKFKQQGYFFSQAIHPSAIFAPDVSFGEGVQIMAGAVIQTGTSIGDNSIINTQSSLDHDCRIGSHVHIAPGVTLSGDVTVGDCVHIGTGASIIQGRKIGINSLVGAGSVVIKDVGEQQMVLGVPARVAKTMKDWKKVLVSPSATIRETIKIIDAEALKIALVVDENYLLLGTVTDGDIRRGILREIDLDSSVTSVMNTKPVIATEADGREKILHMMAVRSLHQIPIVDSRFRVTRMELLENFILRK